MNKVDWFLRIAVAVILGQTLWFKFSGAPESIYIFTTVGLEPYGRYGSGVAEGISAILLLMPRTVIYGAGLALGVISGAIMSHLTKLGIEVQGDHGLLFGLAVTVFVFSAIIALIHRKEIPLIGSRL